MDRQDCTDSFCRLPVLRYLPELSAVSDWVEQVKRAVLQRMRCDAALCSRSHRLLLLLHWSETEQSAYNNACR